MCRFQSNDETDKTQDFFSLTFRLKQIHCQRWSESYVEGSSVKQNVWKIVIVQYR